MLNKYFNRIIIWTLLILLLSIATYFNRSIFVQSLEDEITELKADENSLKNQLTFKSAQINLYNSVYYDNSEIEHMIPTGYNELDVINYYIKRPVEISPVSGKLINYTITRNIKPEQLKLSNNVEGTKINATIEFDDPTLDCEVQIERYIQTLQNTVRSVYLSQISYSKPSEGIDKNQFVYVVQIEYYIFNYLESSTK